MEKVVNEQVEWLSLVLDHCPSAIDLERLRAALTIAYVEGERHQIDKQLKRMQS
jgi:hypothetical protein